MARVPVNTTAATKTGIQNASYTYAADAQASDAYAILLDPAPSAYAAGQEFSFKANTANTGAASLNVNSLGAKTLKKFTDQDLATGDIEAGSIVKVVYDGTNFQVISILAATGGDVTGPAASVDNELPLFSGTGGKTLKRSTGTGVVRVDSGVVSIDSDVTDIVAAGSESAAGKLELATAAETETGTDDTRAVHPAGAAATFLKKSGGTMTGNMQLGENTGVVLDPAGSADGKYSGIFITGISGYAQAFGDLVYLDPTDSRWEACDANAASGADGDSRGLVGMVVVAGTDGNACTILLYGQIRADAKFPAMTINAPMYVSETAGSITGTIPTTTDAVQRCVGFALTADELLFAPNSMFQTAV